MLMPYQDGPDAKNPDAKNPQAKNPQDRTPRGLSPKNIIDEDELAFWKERIHAVPDLRWAKVMRLRRAIHTNGYDESASIDKMLLRVDQDLSVLGVNGLDED